MTLLRMQTNKHRNITKSIISFRSESWRAMGNHRGYEESFSSRREVYYHSGREKLYKKNTR